MSLPEAYLAKSWPNRSPTIDGGVLRTRAVPFAHHGGLLGGERRQLLWFAVTRNPSAEWLAQQIVEAFPWNTAPTYLVRDNDRAYGQVFQRRIRAMGIRDRPISPRSPWQNPYAERLIGTLRRECLDHVLMVGERHLRRMLASYSSYYNESRTHLALEKDARYGELSRRAE